MNKLNILFAYCILSLAPALTRAEPKLKPSGVVALSYQVDDGYIGPEASMRIRGKTRRKHGLRAEMKLEARYFRSKVAIEDAFVDYKYSSNLKFELGVNKKVLGLEYQNGRRKRLMRHRGLVYQSLEGLGVVGRQLNMKLKAEPAQGLEFDVAFGTDGSRNVNGSLSVRHKLQFLSLGYWGQVERHRINKGYLATHAHAVSAWHQSSNLRLAAELFAGVNPDKSALEQELGGEGRAYFVGPTFDLAYRINLAKSVAVEPAFRFSRFYREVTIPNGILTEWTGVINFGWHTLVVAPSYSWIQERSTSEEPTTSRWQLRTDAQYFF